ncbi:MAG: nucleotidyltransferase substrate binding protein [Bdellovibrionota bacterium]
MSNILKQIRWQQRYLNLEKSFSNLETTVLKKNLNTIEQAGLIQYFEITFELCWKTIKDYLEADGISVNSPRDAIKQAFAASIITDGEVWLEALEKRNLVSQIYQEEIANYIATLITTKYYLLFKDLVVFLKNKH